MNSRPLKFFVSPNFTDEKLASPSFEHLVDVFEDRIRHWVLSPAEMLLHAKHGDVAAVSLLLGYFEGMEIYCSGLDSKGRSKEFFERGFKRVFSTDAKDLELERKIFHAIYAEARCGFAHDGMFRNRVFFSRERPEPILITWPKRNGVFDKSRSVESIAINPLQFYVSINIHFTNYIKSLRNGSDAKLRQAFEAAVALKWGLSEPGRVIWMSEEDFFKR